MNLRQAKDSYEPYHLLKSGHRGTTEGFGLLTVDALLTLFGSAICFNPDLLQSK